MDISGCCDRNVFMSVSIRYLEKNKGRNKEA
jgi:hypothetical protein